MTVYILGEPKVPEKTWPVAVGEEERDLIIKIQEITKATIGFDVTHRAIVARAIKLLYEKLTVTE